MRRRYFVSLVILIAPWRLALGAEAMPWQGHQSTVSVFEVHVARDAAAWKSLWRLIGRDAPSGLPKGHMGVALFSGLKPSGGYAVDILGVERRGCLTVVRFSERSPGPDSIVMKILTTPWAVATVTVSEYPVVFERAGGSDGTPLIPLEEASRVAQAKEACGSTLVN